MVHNKRGLKSQNNDGMIHGYGPMLVKPKDRTCMSLHKRCFSATLQYLRNGRTYTRPLWLNTLGGCKVRLVSPCMTECCTGYPVCTQTVYYSMSFETWNYTKKGTTNK